MIKFDIIKQWLQPEKPGWHFSSRLLLSVESLNSGKRRFPVNHATEKISTFEKQNDRSIFQCVCATNVEWKALGLLLFTSTCRSQRVIKRCLRGQERQICECTESLKDTRRAEVVERSRCGLRAPRHKSFQKHLSSCSIFSSKPSYCLSMSKSCEEPTAHSPQERKKSAETEVCKSLRLCSFFFGSRVWSNPRFPWVSAFFFFLFLLHTAQTRFWMKVSPRCCKTLQK